MQNSFDVAIIGAGINGLAAAYALSRHSNLKVAILEQFTVGHPYGGSHGASRITRTVYSHPGYVKLMQRAHSCEWPQLEKEVGSVLIHRNSSCYFGRGKSFQKYLRSIENSGLEIDILEPSQARALFPQFRFSNIEAVLHDRTGGVIAAQETLDRLKTLIVNRGVKLYEKTKVLALDASKDPIQIITDKGAISTARIVMTAGAWIKQLLPSFESLITPIRQTVGYFQLQGPQNAYQIGRFPNWAFIGDGENSVYYGLPEFRCEGIKIARHVTAGKVDDPDLQNISPSPTHVDDLEKFIKENFTQTIHRLVKSETCIYANTPKEDFIIDLLPEDKRIAVGAVCSGHGFKFAPLTGRLLSELALYGKTTVPEFEEIRELFSCRQATN